MNEKQNRQKPCQKPVKHAYPPFVGLLAAGVASYLAALCYLPTSGIFSTLPAAAVLALAASVFCREKWELYALMGVMPCAVTSLLGFSPKRAIFVGIACVFQSVFALLAKRAFLTYHKGRAAVKRKSLLIGIAATLLCLSAYLAAFGNPVNALMAQNRAKETAKERYDGIVTTHATHFDLFSRRYLTEITFDAGEKGTRYYMSVPARDDYDAFCRSAIYEKAKDYFEAQTTLGRESAAVFLENDGRILSPETPFDTVKGDMEYLLELSGNILDKADFDVAAEQMKRFFALSDSFVYKSVTLTAKDADGVRYATVLAPDGVWSASERTDEKALKDKFPAMLGK